MIIKMSCQRFPSSYEHYAVGVIEQNLCLPMRACARTPKKIKHYNSAQVHFFFIWINPWPNMLVEIDNSNGVYGPPGINCQPSPQTILCCVKVTLTPFLSQTGQNHPLCYFTLSNTRQYYSLRKSLWVGKG